MHSKFTLFLITLTLLVVFASQVAAQDVVDEADLIISGGDEVPEIDGGEGPISVFSAWDFVRMLLILAAVIGVIYVVFYFLKRSGKPRLSENRLIRVLSSKPLANNRTLHLIEVGNQVFLVGAAENTVSLVSEIADKETLDGIRLQSSEIETTERRNFGEILSQMFGKPQNGNSGTKASLDPVAFLKGQRQRVKNI
jgi:flagellar protein FliO/FliZ